MRAAGIRQVDVCHEASAAFAVEGLARLGRAKLLHLSRQVILLLGDGAFGFAGMEIDTMVRHGLPVVCIVGNNGVWGLERTLIHEMLGYDAAAALRPETRCDLVAEGLGAYGELVETPAALRPALERALPQDVPAVLNVRIDPEAGYPRATGLQ